MLAAQLESIFDLIGSFPNEHARGSKLYEFLDVVTREAFAAAKIQFQAGQSVQVGEFGAITLPFVQMGAVDSIDLFGLDGLIEFAFYFRTRGKYARAADIGANIGLHSIILSRCCRSVEAYEPDPNHFRLLVQNLELNEVGNVSPVQSAVSDVEGKTEFVRVLGNTTSSHIVGAKKAPYGELERFEVDVVDVRGIAGRTDLLKIDAEGQEAVIIKAVPVHGWATLDAMVEIGTYENASEVYDYFENTDVNLFSQKCGWRKVKSFEDMPTSYKDGGLFISAKPAMPW